MSKAIFILDSIGVLHGKDARITAAIVDELKAKCKVPIVLIQHKKKP